MYTSRSDLRKFYRNARRQLSATQQLQASDALAEQLATLVKPNHKGTTTLSAYLANDGEPGLESFIEQCWQKNITVALPVIHPFCRGHLLFQRFTLDTAMGQNKYKIDEPQLDCTAVIPLAQIDYVLMPLVAFDRNKNRLGMGGGYYDRTLSIQHNRNYNNRAKLIGIAHTLQLHHAGLPTAKWDIPLDNVVTPDYVI